MHDGPHGVGDETNYSQTGTQGARKITARNESVLLRALNEAGLGPVSRAIGHDQSYLSKWRNGDLGLKPDDLFAMLDQLGLKLVSAEGNELLVESGGVRAVPVTLQADPAELTARSTKIEFTMESLDDPGIRLTRVGRFLGPAPTSGR